MGRLENRLRKWITYHPRVASWVFRPVENVEEEDYAAENRHVFSMYEEQERMHSWDYDSGYADSDSGQRQLF